jgi:hypothetical protein
VADLHVLNDADQRPFPPPPDFHEPQPCRLVLDFYDDGERQHWAGSGWGVLVYGWFVFYDDEAGHWQSWPAHAVVCVEWRAGEVVGAERSGTAAS